MTAHRLPAPIRSVRKNHSIGERRSSRYAGFCIPVDEESDIADRDIEGTEFISIGPDFKSFYMKIPASWSNVEDMVKGFAKAALKHWFKHATRADLANPQIYESVRLTLARNFRSTWKIRQVTGELIY